MPPRKTLRTMSALASYRGKVVKFSLDDGDTWTYAKLRDLPLEMMGNEGLGFRADVEVGQGEPLRVAELTVAKLRNGMIVQTTTTAEVKDKKWSFED